jgi:hypothetical protein
VSRPAGLSNCRDDFCDCDFIATANDDARTVGRKSNGNASSNATRSARHHGNAAREVAVPLKHSAPLPCK